MLIFRRSWVSLLPSPCTYLFVNSPTPLACACNKIGEGTIVGGPNRWFEGGSIKASFWMYSRRAEHQIVIESLSVQYQVPNTTQSSLYPYPFQGCAIRLVFASGNWPDCSHVTSCTSFSFSAIPATLHVVTRRQPSRTHTNPSHFIPPQCMP